MNRLLRRKVAAWLQRKADQIERGHPAPLYLGTRGALCCRLAFNLREIAEQINNP